MVDQVNSDVTLAQAREAVAAAGLARFVPPSVAYAFDIGDFPPHRVQIIPIAEIDPPLRDVGVALLPSAQWILDKIRNRAKQLPVKAELLPPELGPYRYRILDGFHRFHLSRALGFTAIPAVVWQYGSDDPA
jgi:hypothetical protein